MQGHVVFVVQFRPKTPITPDEWLDEGYCETKEDAIEWMELRKTITRHERRGCRRTYKEKPAGVFPAGFLDWRKKK